MKQQWLYSFLIQACTLMQAEASKCKTDFYMMVHKEQQLRWCSIEWLQNQMLLKGWVVGGICFSNQLLTQMSEMEAWHTYGAIWCSFFSHASFPLKYLHFPSALLIWSKSLNWIFLLGWVNYMKEHNFDPVPTINTNPFETQLPASPTPYMWHHVGRKLPKRGTLIRD